MKLSLKKKIPLAVSILILLALLAVTINAYQFSKSMVSQSNHQNLDASVKKMNANIDSFLQQAIAKVEGISTSPILIKANPADSVPELARLFPYYKDTFSNISFANISGDRWNYKGEKDTVANREYFKQAISTKKSVISEIVTSNTTGKLSVVVASPLIDEKGTVYATLSLEKIQAFVSNLKYGETGYGIITDAKGLFIVHAKNSEIIGKSDLSKV